MARYCSAVDLAGRDLAAHHEHVRLAGLFPMPVLAGVAVVLLVGAVKLDQLLVLIVEMIDVLGQVLGDGAAQLPAGFLDEFDLGTLGLGGGVVVTFFRIKSIFERNRFTLLSISRKNPRELQLPLRWPLRSSMPG